MYESPEGKQGCGVKNLTKRHTLIYLGEYQYKNVWTVGKKKQQITHPLYSLRNHEEHTFVKYIPLVTIVQLNAKY